MAKMMIMTQMVLQNQNQTRSNFLFHAFSFFFFKISFLITFQYIYIYKHTHPCHDMNWPKQFLKEEKKKKESLKISGSILPSFLSLSLSLASLSKAAGRVATRERIIFITHGPVSDLDFHACLPFSFFFFFFLSSWASSLEKREKKGKH